MTNHPNRSPVHHTPGYDGGSYLYRFDRRGVDISIEAKHGRLEVWLNHESLVCWEGWDWLIDSHTARALKARALDEIRDWLKFHADDDNFGDDEPRAPAELIALAQRAGA